MISVIPHILVILTLIISSIVNIRHAIRKRKMLYIQSAMRVLIAWCLLVLFNIVAIIVKLII